MTTISTHHFVASVPAPRATLLDRVLLRAASTLDSFVAGRLARRGDMVQRRALTTQAAAVGARRDAEARGAIGILP